MFWFCLFGVFLTVLGRQKTKPLAQMFSAVFTVTSRMYLAFIWSVSQCTCIHLVSIPVYLAFIWSVSCIYLVSIPMYQVIRGQHLLDTGQSISRST